MRKFLFLSLLVFACPVAGLAQGSGAYHKLEVYGGFSANQVERPFTVNFQGKTAHNFTIGIGLVIH